MYEMQTVDELGSWDGQLSLRRLQNEHALFPGRFDRSQAILEAVLHMGLKIRWLLIG